MNRIEASKAAHELLQMMKPFLDRAQIAGSIRRKKENVKDIEIVAIPKNKKITNMFGEVMDIMPMTEYINFVDMLEGWKLDNIVKRNGKKYKRLFNPDLNVCCDLFLTDLDRWGYQITIRTGPADFSRKVVTIALERGWHFTDSLLHVHPKIADIPCSKGDSCPLIKPIVSEEALFEALGLPWIEPKDRN